MPVPGTRRRRPSRSPHPRAASLHRRRERGGRRVRPAGTTYGVVGRPLNRHSPFYIGFFGATGALLAIGLWSLVGRLTTTLTLLIVSLFLALALNPLVDALIARGVRRSRPSGSCSPASSWPSP